MLIATAIVGLFLCWAILAAAGQITRAIYALNETLVSLWRIREELQEIKKVLAKN